MVEFEELRRFEKAEQDDNRRNAESLHVWHVKVAVHFGFDSD